MDTDGIRLQSSRKRQQRCRGLPASYTVEASYVMTIVILSLSFMIGAAYENCRRITGVMRLHQMVEFVRLQEDGENRKFAFQTVSGSARREGDKAYGTVSDGSWAKTIESDVHRPESMMRMLTVFDNASEGENGDDGA